MDAGTSVTIYQTKGFNRFARKAKITAADLLDAVDRAHRGLIDADLGGGLIKQRIARPGQGKRGGHRGIVAYWVGDLAVFLFGFSKNELENIGPQDLADLRLLAKGWFESDATVARDLETGVLIEVKP
jgi:hypothetical protein